MRLARIAVIVVAVAACAFFGLGIRQAHDLSAAQSIVQSPASVKPAQAARARSLLHAAAVLNPDRTVAMTRGQLALRLGDTASAGSIFSALVKAEPKNVEAWLGLSETLYGKRYLSVTLRKLAELDPQDAKRR